MNPQKLTLMKEFFTKIRFTKAEKLLLVAATCLLLSFWWFSNHVWFRIDNHKITINEQSAAERSDYSCFKSINRDIFCYHQDNGTHYLISPRNNEISVISENAGVIHLEDVLLSATFLNRLITPALNTNFPMKFLKEKDLYSSRRRGEYGKIKKQVFFVFMIK
jgi:hypothetical protein